jgi:hypothetical protein
VGPVSPENRSPHGDPVANFLRCTHLRVFPSGWNIAVLLLQCVTVARSVLFWTGDRSKRNDRRVFQTCQNWTFLQSLQIRLYKTWPWSSAALQGNIRASWVAIQCFTFFCKLFLRRSELLDYVTSSGRLLEEREILKDLEGRGLRLIKLLSTNVPGYTEEKHVKRRYKSQFPA